MTPALTAAGIAKDGQVADIRDATHPGKSLPNTAGELTLLVR